VLVVGRAEEMTTNLEFKRFFFLSEACLTSSQNRPTHMVAASKSTM